VEVEPLLRHITEDESDLPYHPGSWSRKQLLGHLIDSATANHVRFVRASLQNEYHGPAYDQEGWVRRHHYETQPWTTLIDWWLMSNQLIIQVMKAIPQEKCAVPCFVEKMPAMSLESLMEAYLIHMDHHLHQLLGTA
jgi:hypothetical protein